MIRSQILWKKRWWHQFFKITPQSSKMWHQRTPKLENFQKFEIDVKNWEKFMIRSRILWAKRWRH